MEAKRDDRPAAQCFTCPRERRGNEAGWHYVDLPDRARGYRPSRIFVCPRHYRQFAAVERGRWTELDAPVFVESAALEVPAVASPVPEPPILVAAATAPAWPDANPALEADAAPPDSAIAALGLIDTLASDS